MATTAIPPTTAPATIPPTGTELGKEVGEGVEVGVTIDFLISETNLICGVNRDWDTCKD